MLEYIKEHWGNAGINFQEPVTPVMHQIYEFHNVLLCIIFSIAISVFCILIYSCIKFRAKPGRKAATFTHGVAIEILWTAIPTALVIWIISQSLPILKEQESLPPKTEFTLKVLAHQWYWTYIYPDHKDIEFDSYMKQDKDLKEGELRLLTTDNAVVLPIKTNINIQVTSADVIHSWTVPAFGVKRDAIPGKLNEMWINIEKSGTYYGQCSELCGINHGFMPIMIKAVDKEEFNAWIKEQNGDNIEKTSDKKIDDNKGDKQ